MGFSEFFKDAWNAIDVVTILFSIITIGLWAARFAMIVIRLGFFRVILVISSSQMAIL